MHELGITRDMVDIVSEHAAGRKVVKVTLEVGRLSGLVADSIAFCFEICSQGTPLESATLEIVDVEGRGHCAACGADPVIDLPIARCPVCQSPALRIVAGTELRIRLMELESCV